MTPSNMLYVMDYAGVCPPGKIKTEKPYYKVHDPVICPGIP